MLKCLKTVCACMLASGMFGLIAIEGLEAAGKADDAKKFTEQLKTTTDSKKKIEALKELGQVAQVSKSLVQDAVPYIVKALQDKEAAVRAAAAHAYGRTGPDPKVGVEQLTRLLKDDKSEEVKIGAAMGLAAMGSEAKGARADLRMIQVEEKKKDMKKQTKLARAASDAIRAIDPGKNK